MKDSSTEFEMYIDGYLKQNLDIVLTQAIPNDWDVLSIYLGAEGSGKSTLAIQNALYCDHNFNLDNVVFTPQQFDHILDICPKGSSIVWDEAITGANAQLYAFMISIKIISKLTQIRRKNLKIFICFPYLHLLNDYFVKRSTYGIYVRAKSYSERGYFNFYSLPRLENLFQLMKEKYRYNNNKAYASVMPNFFGRFTKFFPLNKAQYDLKKERATLTNKENCEMWRERCIKLLAMLKRNNIKVSAIAKELDVSNQFLYQLMKESELVAT